MRHGANEATLKRMKQSALFFDFTRFCTLSFCRGCLCTGQAHTITEVFRTFVTILAFGRSSSETGTRRTELRKFIRCLLRVRGARSALKGLHVYCDGAGKFCCVGCRLLRARYCEALKQLSIYTRRSLTMHQTNIVGLFYFQRNDAREACAKLAY